MHRLASLLLSVLMALSVGALPVGQAAAKDLRQVPESARQVKLSYAPIVKSVAGAVVNVYAERRVQQRVSPLMNDPFFRHFFGDQRSGMPRQRVQRSLGSGVVVSGDGIVVTNHHVIKNATDIRVAFSDRREVKADLILKDSRTDLAVLRLRDKGPYHSVQIAEPNSVEVGDLVLAIGNPFGVGQTVTSGIVSALARTDVGVSDYQFFIQTDAAINPGNSGGALIDMQGQLVGINTAIFTRSGGSNGIGFAIPVAMVRAVLRSAETGQKVVRPWFGADLQNVTNDIATSLGLKRPRGIMVARLHRGSPAKEAGLEAGDVVLAIDGQAVNSPQGFNFHLATKELGKKARLRIFRNGREMDVTVQIAKAPETTPRDVRTLKNFSPFSGAVIANLSPAVAEEIGLRGDDRGVVVMRVQRNSTAHRIGLRTGDLLLAINGRTIKTTRQVQQLTGVDRGFWRVTINRNGRIIKSAFGG